MLEAAILKSHKNGVWVTKFSKLSWDPFSLGLLEGEGYLSKETMLLESPAGLACLVSSASVLSHTLTLATVTASRVAAHSSAVSEKPQ